MELSERIRRLMAALPSDASAVTLTRADLAALMEGTSPDPFSPAVRDLTVEEVAEETHRAPSTVRGWLIAGDLKGYKLNGRDWRVTRAALRAYLDNQKETTRAGRRAPDLEDEVDIAAWRGGDTRRPRM